VKKILVRIFAVIGLIVTISFIIGAVSTWLFFTSPAPEQEAPKNIVLQLDLTIPIVEKTPDMSFSLASLLEAEEEMSLLDIIRSLDRAKEDPHVKGVVARFGPLQPSFVHAQEIRAALERFKKSGKFSYVYAANYGSFGQGNRTYYLASSFENIWLQPVGTVGLTGLGVEAPFGKTALSSIGISADFLRREEYKSVMENISRDDFSPPVRANMESMLKSLMEQEVTGLSENLKIDAEKVRTLMANGPYTASEALRLGLITRIGYADEMLNVAKLRATEIENTIDCRSDSGLTPTLATPSMYLSYSRKMPETKATVALIDGAGLIADMPARGPSGFTSEHVINIDQVVQAFADAAADDEVKAILFRVDSPGGAPDASETIRHALVKAKKAKKPVFVSMGEVAASGGYWISMNADHIVAEPATITGSIGVVAGKFVLGGLWKKLGIQWDGMQTSENAAMWSSRAPFTEKGRERMNALLDETYKAFTDNVAAARKIPPEKMPEIAKGRVWTGEQALKVGLVDELGGFQTTVMAIKKKLGLEPTDPIALKPFPAPETPITFVLNILKNLGIESAMVRSALGSLQRVKSAIGPVLEGLEDTGPVAVRVPPEILRMVK